MNRATEQHARSHGPTIVSQISVNSRATAKVSILAAGIAKMRRM